jgi:hypothetical protein
MVELPSSMYFYKNLKQNFKNALKVKKILNAALLIAVILDLSYVVLNRSSPQSVRTNVYTTKFDFLVCVA